MTGAICPYEVSFVGNGGRRRGEAVGDSSRKQRGGTDRAWEEVRETEWEICEILPRRS